MVLSEICKTSPSSYVQCFSLGKKLPALFCIPVRRECNWESNLPFSTVCRNFHLDIAGFRAQAAMCNAAPKNAAFVRFLVLDWASKWVPRISVFAFFSPYREGKIKRLRASSPLREGEIGHFNKQ